LLALGAFIGSWLLCFCYRVQEAAAKDFSFLGHPTMACKNKNKKTRQGVKCVVAHQF
jgi:hypothetical protein